MAGFQVTTEAKNASKTKFTCHECQQNAWAKPGAALICVYCYEHSAKSRRWAEPSSAPDQIEPLPLIDSSGPQHWADEIGILKKLGLSACRCVRSDRVA